MLPILNGLRHYEPLDARFGRPGGAGRQRLPGDEQDLPPNQRRRDE